MVCGGVHAGTVQDRKDSRLRECQIGNRCNSVRVAPLQVRKEMMCAADAGFSQTSSPVPMCVHSEGR